MFSYSEGRQGLCHLLLKQQQLCNYEKLLTKWLAYRSTATMVDINRYSEPIIAHLINDLIILWLHKTSYKGQQQDIISCQFRFIVFRLSSFSGVSDNEEQWQSSSDWCSVMQPHSVSFHFNCIWKMTVIPQWSVWLLHILTSCLQPYPSSQSFAQRESSM